LKLSPWAAPWAILGYLASGEIASFEEQQEFEEFRKKQQEQAVADAIDSFGSAKTLDELKKAFVDSRMMDNPLVVAAKDKRKAELAKVTPAPAPKPATAAKTPPQKPATPTETPKPILNCH
jgi:hypothetical protein